MTQDLKGLPKTIDRYQLLSLLGVGGMGRVVRAHDPKLKRDVALKLIESTPEDEEKAREVRFFFHREARATAALRHPNIIEIYDYSGPEAELPFIACELIEGETLRELLNQEGRLPSAVGAALGFEITSALVHAHSKNIIHRDLKPENIFLSDDGRVVLADFGIAKAFEQAGASDATIQYGKTRLYGSPSYIAPEQLAGAAASPQSDLFALGALLYELLTGEPPFTGGDLAAILKAVAQAKFGGFDAAIPVGTSFQELIQSLVQKDPALRPASTQDVANKLRHILDLEEISDPRLFLAKTDQATRDLQKIERQKEGAVEEATEIFKTSTPSGLHIKKKPINELITRIPFFFAFAGIALALGAGFYVLPKLRVTAAKESASLDAQGLSEEENKKRALVLFRFEGQAELRIDEKLIGRFEERVRLSMFGGEHRVQLEGAKIHIDQKVRIIAESQPEFDFRP